MRSCALCAFATESDQAFREHMIDVHGFPPQGSVARTAGYCFAIALSMVGLAVIALGLIGMAWTDYGYTSAARAWINLLLLLAALFIVGFDVAVFGGRGRWRNSTAVAAACVAGFVLCFFVASTLH